ncbi:hypothetical protein C0995_005750 [Termitomyces sp. Mi166|nr:hypothetical protein C0995_005750 [Termitomyces sp. Mi166\
MALSSVPSCALRSPVTKRSNHMLPIHAGPASQVVATPSTSDPLKGGKGDTKEHPCWLAKKKGKGKAKDSEPSVMADEEVASLLQHLHDTEVPEEVYNELLNSQLVQLAFIQLLDELDTTC